MAAASGVAAERGAHESAGGGAVMRIPAATIDAGAQLDTMPAPQRAAAPRHAALRGTSLDKLGLTLILDVEHCVAPRPTARLKGSREKYVDHCAAMERDVLAALPAGAALSLLVNRAAPPPAAPPLPAGAPTPPPCCAACHALSSFTS